MAKQNPIATADLVIRGTTFEDCDDFAIWEKQENVNQYLCLTNDHSYKEIVSDYFRGEADPQIQQFTIFKKQGEVRIGRIVLTKINRKMDSMNFTTLYIADPELRRKGYGEQAAKAMLEYAFLVLHMERVSMDHLKEDVPASMFCRKLGFQSEGILRHAGKQQGKYVDFYRMAMLRQEYYGKLHEK